MIRRIGNFGFVDNGAGELYTFSLNAKAGGWSPSSYMLRGATASFGYKYINVNGTPVIPYGEDNNLPGKVRHLLENFYAGEGIMGKKAGLQWGEGPRLYRDAVDSSNIFYRAWTVDDEITADLKSTDYLTQLHRCLIDLVHLEGFWVKFTLTRGSRIGAGRIATVEHVPAGKVRFVYPGENRLPTRAMVADWPAPDPATSHVYPLFDPCNPLKHPVSMAYFNIYSYNHDHYSVPRFIGAFDWLELAGTLAPLLAAYNENAAAISKHIKSPQSYWDRAEERIKDVCRQKNIPYRSEMLEDFKDEAMEKFASSMSGKENAGKFLHTSDYWNPEANEFEGWEIVAIDNKVKDYIEAQVAICKKSEAAATSGFGLDPSLSNLILDTKLGSGSEKLYALKVYNATETAVPDMILCKPFQIFIDVNHPGTDIKIGLYRTIVEAEKNVNPENRVKANA
nr:hypothetical protein [uncultured Alistipes sp.]